MSQQTNLLDYIVNLCKDDNSISSVMLARILQDYPQYPIVKEYVKWEYDQLVKSGYDNTDIKLYWYVRGRAKNIEILKTLFYVEGLILLYTNNFSDDYFTIACLKIFEIYTDIKLVQNTNICEIANMIKTIHTYIMNNKEDILEGKRTWRPEPKHVSFSSMKVIRNYNYKEQFVKLLDDCKEITGHRTYSFCLEYFKVNTGRSKTTFDKCLKKYGISFDEKEPRGGFKGKGTKTRKWYWVDHIQDKEWTLKISEIRKLVERRLPEFRTEKWALTDSMLSNWKYKKMKELGLKK